MLKTEHLDEREDVYDLQVEDTHNFYANGILVKNCEIDLPTQPLYQDSGEISLCTLSAINWGKINEPEDFERPCTIAVRALDELLDYQDYPVEAARSSTMDRRPLGVGIINLAYWMAKNDIQYDGIDRAGLNKLHQYVEAWSYYLIKASADLAKEKGPCRSWHETKYSLGLLPIDTYKKEVDELVDPVYYMPWIDLRLQIQQTGIRNSTLMALMPAETSAAISNSTNGIEPPRSLVSVKQSKDGVLKQVVPGIHRLKNKYDLLWDQESPEGYLKVCAVMQKFIDQGISVNTSYNPKHYEGEQIPMSVLLHDLLTFYRFGGKQLYYFQQNDAAGELDTAPVYTGLPPRVSLPIITDLDCESCKI